MTDGIVTKQPIDSSKAIFEMSARTATTGSAILVKEAGAWKVEDEIWAVPLPKPAGGS